MDEVRGAHTVVRKALGTEQIPEIAELVRRAQEVGLHVMEDLPGRTAYATAGVSIYAPDKRPPATLVVEYVRAGTDAPWALFAAVLYPARSKTFEYPVSDPAEAAELIDTFLENHRA